MQVLVSSPFGSLSEESGLVYLLSNYIRSTGVQLSQLRCNGAFSVCDRDAETAWRRTIESCVSCMQDQSALANWAGIESMDISQFLTPEETEQTRRWMYKVPYEQFPVCTFDGVRPFDSVRGTFRLRFGTDTPDIMNRHHESFLRRVMLAGIRMRLLAKRLFEFVRPDLVFITAGRDFISSSLMAEAVTRNIGCVLFQWHLEERCVKITHPRKREALSCELVMNRILSMRSDFRTWPLELVTILDDILAFLEMPRAELLYPPAANR